MHGRGWGVAAAGAILYPGRFGDNGLSPTISPAEPAPEVRLVAVNYIPATDSGLNDWGDNFATLITADPPRYGLDSAAALAIQTAQDTYAAAFALGGSTNRVPVNPSTRSPVTVSAKDAAKVAARGLFRTYAAQIRLDPGVTNSDKIALGLNLPNNSPAPIPTPVSWPVLSVLSGGPLSLVLKYHDSIIGTGKAKAAGALQCQLVATPSATAITSPDGQPIRALLTKVPTQVVFGSEDGGKVCYIWGRWVTRRGLVGPWSDGLTATIMAG